MEDNNRLVEELRDVLVKLKESAGISRTTTVLGRRVTGWDTGKLNQCLIRIDTLLTQWFEGEEYDEGDTSVEICPEIFNLKTNLAWNQLGIYLSKTEVVADRDIPTLLATLRAYYQWDEGNE